MPPPLGASVLAALLAQDSARDLTHTSESTAAPASEADWALVIGVDQYDNPQIADLRFSGQDARAIAATLLDSGAYDADHVIVMTTDQADPRLRPTRSNLLAQLAALDVLHGVDTLFFYYSGHGAASESDRTNYIFPQDTSPDLPAQTGIRIDDLLQDLDGVDAKRRFIVLDACRNQLLSGARASPTAWYDQQYDVAGGTQILYGTTPGQYAYEDDGASLGAMTSFMVQGLRGAADGAGEGQHDGVITSNELYTWLDTEMRERSAATGRTQVPGRGGDWWGADFKLLPVPVGQTDVHVSCPAHRSDLSRALDAAGMAPSSSAIGNTRAAFACLNQPFKPDLAARYHAFEGLAETSRRDTSLALGSFRAAHEILPSYTLDSPDDLSVQIWGQALTETASPRVQVTIPDGVRLRVDGRVDETVPTDRPAILQATRGHQVQWTRMHMPDDGLPQIVVAPRTPTQRAARGLRIASEWTGGVSAVLWAGALLERANYYREKDRVLEHHNLNYYGGGVADDYGYAILLGYAAETTTGLALGMGGLSFTLSRF